MTSRFGFAHGQAFSEKLNIRLVLKLTGYSCIDIQPHLLNGDIFLDRSGIAAKSPSLQISFCREEEWTSSNLAL
jgi:hypothetical protein